MTTNTIYQFTKYNMARDRVPKRESSNARKLAKICERKDRSYRGGQWNFFVSTRGGVSRQKNIGGSIRRLFVGLVHHLHALTSPLLRIQGDIAMAKSREVGRSP